MQPFARFNGHIATDLVDVTHDASVLDKGGWWAVVLTYEGRLTAARFNRVERREQAHGETVPAPGVQPIVFAGSGL